MRQAFALPLKKSQQKSQTHQRKAKNSPLEKRLSQAATTWESQAEAAARGVVQGEKNLFRILTPAPCAEFVLAQSSGVPLAAGVRERMEAGFNADFSRVRIHRDAAAAAAVEAEGAQAFTAGNHIYLDSAFYEPHTPGGEQLLAHELAHVLQQSGRRNSQGGLWATDCQGSGELQFRLFPTYGELKQKHAPKGGIRGRYRQFTRKLDKTKIFSLVFLTPTGWMLPGPQYSVLDKFVKDNIKQLGSWPAEAESLLYDCLKASYLYDSAVELLLRDNLAGSRRIRTILFSPEIFQRIKKSKFYRMMVRDWRKQPLTAPYWRFEIWRLTKKFLFMPLDKKVHVAYRKTAQGKYISILADDKQLSADGKNIQLLTMNEWAAQSLSFLAEVEEGRVGEFKRIMAEAEQESVKHKDVALSRKYRRALKLRDWGRYLVRRKQKGWAAWLWARVGKKMAALAEGALAVWKEVIRRQELLNLARAGSVSEKKLKQEFALSRFTRYRLFRVHLAGLKKLLNAGSRLQFAKKAGKLPLPSQYARLGGEQAAIIRAKALQWDKKVWRYFIQGKKDLAVGLTWLRLWGEYIASVFAEADLSNLGKKWSPEDWVIAHRIRLARRLRVLALVMGWKTLVKNADDIIHARKEEKSQLALLSQWKEDKGSMDRMVEDFGSHRLIRGLEPLTAYHLVLLFRTSYYQKINEQFRKLLPKPEAHARSVKQSLKGEYVPLYNRAVDAVKKNFPKRWKVLAFDVALKKGEKKKKKGSKKKEPESFGKLLESHKKTKAHFKSEAGEGRPESITPVEYRGSIFLWTMPKFDQIKTTLHSLPELKSVVKMQLAAEGKSAKQSAAVDKDLSLWWQTLIRAFDKKQGKVQLTPEQKQSFVESISRKLQKKERTAWTLVEKNVIRAISHHREVLARRAIIPRLKKYRPGKLGAYSEPSRALGQIRGFVATVGSLIRDQAKAGETQAFTAQQELQTAALFLEIAPQLSSSLKGETRYNLVTGYLDYLATAVQVADASGRREALKAVLSPSQQNDSFIEERLKKLQEVYTGFQTVQKEVQRKFGFQAFAGKALHSVGWAHAVKPGKTFRIEGDFYLIHKIHESFIFHPPYGQQTGTSVKGGGYKEALFLTLEGKELKLSQETVLLTVYINGRKQPVKRKDVHLLQKISHVVAMQSFVLSLSNLEKIINDWAELMLDIMELIPGWGLVITASRIAQAITKFFVSGEYEDIKKTLSGDIKAKFEELKEDLNEAFQPDNLVLFFLFGPEPGSILHTILSKYQGVAKPKKAAKKEATAARGRFGGARKALAGLKSIWKKLLRSAAWINRKVQHPMNVLSDFVATRPILSLVFRITADNIHYLEQINKLNFEGLSLKEVRQQVASAKGGLDAKVQKFMAAIAEFQLPDTIFDMQPVFASAVNMMIHFITKRLGAKGKAVSLVLSSTGLDKMISAKIAAGLLAAGLDPNEEWRNTMVPAIGNSVNRSREEIISTLNAYLPKLGFSRFKTPTPFTVKTGELPGDKEPQLSGDREPELSPPGIPRVAGGTPLAAPLRDKAEEDWGADFSHVRLHQGRAGAEMTEIFFVDAITAGSHIYLRPGINPESAAGEKIFYHELAHVLQQTGFQEAGGGVSRGVVEPRSQGGLRLNRASEAQAEQLAALAQQGEQPREDLHKTSGYQPKLKLLTLSRLLHRISSVVKMEKRYDYLTSKAAAAVTGLSGEVKSAVTNLVEAVWNLKGAVKAKVFTGKPAVLNALKTRLQFAVGSKKLLINVALLLAREENDRQKKEALSRQAKPSKRGKKPLNENVVPLKPFIQRLEDYIFVKSGVLVKLKNLKLTSHPPSSTAMVIAPKRGSKKLNATDPLTQVEIKYLHMPFAGRRVKGSALNLWELVLKNSWPDVQERELAFGFLRPLLNRKGVSPVVWPSTGSNFTFGLRIKREIKQLIKAEKGKGAKLTTVPPWKEYVKTGTPSQSKWLKIGLRVGTYGDAIQKKAAERESHHTTQFLLLEYFANKHPKKQPFAPGLDYPGVSWNSGNTTVKQFGKSKAIPLDNTRTDLKNRGGGMPAILLAATTHRKGKLHVTPKAADESGASTQSGQVDNWFKAKLPKRLYEARSRQKLSSYLQRPDGIGRQATAVKKKSHVEKQIRSAMVHSYRSMRSQMRGRLKDALPQMELDYFKALTERVAPPPPNQPLLAAADEKAFIKAAKFAVKKAEEKNKEIMEVQWHWTV